MLISVKTDCIECTYKTQLFIFKQHAYKLNQII